MAEEKLTQSERATYQALRARGWDHEVALNDALDGVHVEDVRKMSEVVEVVQEEIRRAVELANASTTVQEEAAARMRKAVDALMELRGSTRYPDEEIRLSGKIEGVKLALSYLEEEVAVHG